MKCSACNGTQLLLREVNQVAHRFGQEFREDVMTWVLCDDCTGGEEDVHELLAKLAKRN